LKLNNVAFEIEINIEIPQGIRKFFWFLNEKCMRCGGALESHINGKYYCDACGRKE
jgi:ribosomal protein S27AE